MMSILKWGRLYANEEPRDKKYAPFTFKLKEGVSKKKGERCHKVEKSWKWTQNLAGKAIKELGRDKESAAL